ncbi:MAG TPA: hypothetical protein VGF14_08405 [Alphaproteobacteria bacterium]
MAQNNTPTNTPTNAAADTANVSASSAAPANVKGVDMGMIVDTSGPNINPGALDASAAIQERAGRAQQNPNFGQGPDVAAKNGAIGYTSMNFGKVETLHKPEAGKTVTVTADAGEQFKVDFDPNAAQLSVRNGDLIFTFNDGAQIVVDHFVMASNQMPSLLLPDGTLLAGGVVVAQLTGKSADDLFNIETAAGPGAGGAAGSGGFIYSDDLGDVIDLLDKLPPILFSEMAFNAPTDRQPPFLLAPDFAPGAQPPINDIVDETGGYGVGGVNDNNERTGTVIPDFGKDGAGSIALQPGFTADGSVAGGTLTSHGVPVTTVFENGMVIGKAGNETVFTMEVQPDGTYNFKLLGQLDHADTSNPDDLMNLHFTYVVSDKDGDQAIGEITIGVRDDGPVANPDTNEVKIIVHEYNVIGGAPDFPTLQEQTNLPVNRPDLYQQGVDKASNVFIDLPTTVTIDRFQSGTTVSGFASPLFAFTQDAQGNITNIQLIFGDATANPSNNGPTHADYQMESGGKLGFFLAGGGTEALKEIGAIDANGNIQPGFSFSLKANDQGTYDIQYTHNGATNTLMSGDSAFVARFAGDFLGQDIQGVAGRQDGDGNNVLRYGFEDLPKNLSDEDYNDIQIKVTINPIHTDTALPITGNVLPNDVVGEDPVHGGPITNHTVVTQVAFENGAFKQFDNAPDAGAAKGKFLTIQGEYGLLKIYENGEYTYTYNVDKQNGDFKDVFRYTMRDQDGDTSTTTLTIGIDNPVVIKTPDPQDPYENGGNNDPVVPSGVGAVLDEDDLPGPDSVTKDITFTAPDGVDTIKMTTDGLPSLTSNGQPVTYTLSPDGKTLTGTAGGETVFTVVIGTPVQQSDNSYKAPYTFTLEKPLDNPGTGENVTNIPVKFDVTDTDGDKATGTLPLQIVDDVPVAVDDSKAMGTSSVTSGNIITNDDFGADGQAPNMPKINSISYGGETKTFAGPDSVVSFTTPKGMLEIHADGSYTFTRNANLGELNETFTYTIKDEDGDISNAKLVITGNDNPVTITGPDPQNPYANGNGAPLDEDDLPVPGTDSVTKEISFTAPDGVESIKLNTDGLPSLTSNGQPVTYTLSQDGKTLTGTAGNQTVFTVAIGTPVQQPDNSYKTPYTFTLLQPLTNPGSGENVTNIPVKFVVTDTDGDNATGTLPLQVIDDVPVAVDDSKAMGTSAVATGNIITNDAFGADGQTPNAPKVTSITYGGETKSFAGPDSVVSFTTPKGTLEIHADGSYTFTRNASLGELNETFDYKITDRDGDISDAKLVITGTDNPVTITGPDPQNPYGNGNGAPLDEGSLLVPGTDSIVKDISFTAPDGLASIKLTTDGLPSLTSQGQSVTYTLSPDGKTLTGSANGQPVFTVVLGNPVEQPDHSYKTSYTYTLLQPLDNPGTGENVTNILVKFIATDTDGDSATGTLPLQVIDDVPVANDDVNVVNNGGSVNGNVVTASGQGNGADVLSADGPNNLTSVSFGGVTKSFANGADTQVDVNGRFITINGDHGQLKIYENGQYTYQHTAGSGATTDQFTYVLGDRDGDTDPATLTITATNTVPTIPDIQGDKVSDETTDINVSIIGNVSYNNASSVALGTANGSSQFMADGSLKDGALTSNGQAVHVALIDGKYVGYTGSDANASGAKVFELTMNGSQYSFKQFSNLDHGNSSDPNDVINLKFAVTARDDDGDTDTGLLNIAVRDDAPVANPDTNQATTIIREFNVIGGAPDFPTLQEQKNLIADRPDLYEQGTVKASNVDIDLPTTVVIDRIKSTTLAAGQHSALFAFTLTGDAAISNVQLIFGIASSNPEDNGPMSGEYQMTSGGKLGFFILQDATQLMKDIGATDSEGNLQPGYTFNVVHKDDGSYKVQYTHDGQTHDLSPNVMFGGDMLDQPIHGVAGRMQDDPNNVLRYGFEDLPLNSSDTDYNDVQFKVTINPIITEVTDPISGNVLPNDHVGQDDIPGLSYGTHVSQVALGDGSFLNFGNPSGTDGGGKFINIQGEYGLLKMYENGQYTYVYNTDKKDGDMQDDFRYTIVDNDGDTSNATGLTISINLDDQTKTVSLFSAKSVDTGFAPGENDNNGPAHKRVDTSTTLEDHDVAGKVDGDAVSYTLGHQGDASVFNTELTVNGAVVKAIVIGDTVHGFIGEAYDNRDIFTLTLQADGNYAFDLHDKVDQGGVVSFDYTGKEVDGSAVEGHLAIGVDGDTAVAVGTHHDSLNLGDVLGPQGGSGSDNADSMNHVASIDIINDILSDDDPHNGYNG